MMDRKQILEEWHSSIRRLHFAHNVEAARFERLRRNLGFTATALSTVVGTTVFATLETSPNLYVKILVGLLSIAAAVLASLQTFLNYPELAEKHKVAAVEYGELRRIIEKLWASPPSEDALGENLASIDKAWGELSKKSPVISQRLWNQIDRKIEMSKSRAAHE
jgi:hypothetical protein